MSTRKIVLIVVGALAGLVGLGLLTAGGALVWAHGTQRDADGYFTSPSYELATDGYAVISEEVDLGAHPGDWLPAPGDLTFRVSVTPSDQQGPVFVGIATETDARTYLGGVSHAQVVRVEDDPPELIYRHEDGSAVPTRPTSAAFWEASVVGTGEQTLSWDATRGSWMLVVMNADGAPGIASEVTAAVKTDLIVPVATGLVIAGLVLSSLGALLLFFGGASSGGTEDDESPASASNGVYPVRIEGQLDPELSRGMWLVKWLLALPHVVVLAVLSAAGVLLTFAAGIAILFTGRYPRSIFDFNVGVLRWWWRVGFYAFGPLGTDRYPPFRLGPDDSYPASFDVAYPERLSRGLVLIKWWLLAIPHYIIVGIFMGPLVSWSVDSSGSGGAQFPLAGGLISLLSLVAVIALAVRGRYPGGLFDLIMGLERWAYRVVAYVALMTDEYPPFRLDTGGEEPGVGAPTAGAPSGDGTNEREPALT